MIPKEAQSAASAQSWSLQSQVAFVPGGYGGLGSAICRGLAAAGALPIVAGRDPGKAEALVQELRAAGHAADSAQLDATEIGRAHV